MKTSMDKGQRLKASHEFEVRFSEVDSMQIVWHGSYALYFEDAREAFGRKYGLDYLTIFGAGYYAPLVDLRFEYRSPLLYGERARIEAAFRNTPAAKIVFDYEIFALEKGGGERPVASGSSTQVFLDRDRHLVLYSPPFFEEWKRKNGLM